MPLKISVRGLIASVCSDSSAKEIFCPLETKLVLKNLKTEYWLLRPSVQVNPLQSKCVPYQRLPLLTVRLEIGGNKRKH